MFKEATDAEKEASRVNKQKLESIQESISSSQSKLESKMEDLWDLYNQKVKKFENTDDEYNDQAAEVKNKYTNFFEGVWNVAETTLQGASDLIRGVFNGLVELVTGLVSFAGDVGVVALSGTIPNVIEPTALKEKADDTVDTYIESVAQIIKDPMGVAEAVTQSVADTVEEEGAMYVTGNALSVFTPGTVVKVASKVKRVSKLSKAKDSTIPRDKNFLQKKVDAAKEGMGKIEVPVPYKEELATGFGKTSAFGMGMRPLSELRPQMFAVRGEGKSASKTKGNGELSKGNFGGYTKGFNIKPKYSNYNERVKLTPVNKGRWRNDRAESIFISDKTGEIKKYLDEAGVDGVEYKNGMPDFSPFSKGELKLENMTNDRKLNFSTADELLAKKWSTSKEKWTADDIADWREDNKYTWHELNDLETVQLVPSKINSVFKHLGGVGEYNLKIRMGG